MSQPTHTFIENIENRLDMAWLSVFIVAALSTLSFVATFRGFQIFFGEIDNTGIDIFMAATLTLIIQAAIVYSVWNIKGSALFRIPFWIIIYMLCVFFSVGFGYAFWFEKLRASDLSRELAEESTMAIVAPIELFISRYASIGARFQEISDESTRLSHLEATKGGTCHPEVPQGYGQMAQYRADDAQLFATENIKMQHEISSLRSSLHKVVSGDFASKPINEQKKVLTLLVGELQLQYDPDASIKQLSSLLQTQIIRANTIVDSVVITGGTRQKKRISLCAPDAKRKSAHLAIVENIKLPKPPSIDDIELVDSSDKREVLNYAFGGLIYHVFKLIDMGEFLPGGDGKKYKHNTADIFPLLLGLNVDILILLFSRRKHPRQVDAKRRIRALGRVYDTILMELSKVFPSESALKVIDVFDAHIVRNDNWWSRHTHSFIILQDKENKDGRKLTEFLDHLVTHKLCKLLPNKHFRNLPKSYQREIQGSLGNPERKKKHLTGTYNVYPIEAEILADIKSQLRNVNKSGISPSSPRTP